MFDAFPYEEWSEDIAGFWTFGPEGSTGTYILTVLGIAVMLVALIGFVILENRKLAHQEAMLKASGALDRPGGGAVVVETTTIVTETDR
jgi:hypothetical protein